MGFLKAIGISMPWGHLGRHSPQRTQEFAPCPSDRYWLLYQNAVPLRVSNIEAALYMLNSSGWGLRRTGLAVAAGRAGTRSFSL